jgi:hypothetical protein
MKKEQTLAETIGEVFTEMKAFDMDTGLRRTNE